MIPNAKIEALENAPPENIFNNPKIPSEVCCLRASNESGFTPGNTTNDPNLYTKRNKSVLKIFVRSSSIEKMFFTVLKKFFIRQGL